MLQTRSNRVSGVYANFCPRKYLWEVRQLHTLSLPNSDNWWEQEALFRWTLSQLRSHGVRGLRLNIFNFELLHQPHEPFWNPAELFLGWAAEADLAIDWCLGPFQYPLWPGIRLPVELRADVPQHGVLTDIPELHNWGQWWATTQLEFLQHYPQITGVYLENEWHTAQGVEDHASGLLSLSPQWVAELSALVTQYPQFQALFNTNFDASQIGQIIHVFQPLRTILGAQFSLGLDVYPSRVSWLKTPQLQAVHRPELYALLVQNVERKLQAPVFWGEFEAQPWGSGQSWVTWWENPTEYSPDWLVQQYRRYLALLPNRKVTLWGAEFWLVSALRGYKNPLQQVQTFAQFVELPANRLASNSRA